MVVQNIHGYFTGTGITGYWNAPFFGCNPKKIEDITGYCMVAKLWF